MKSDNVAGTYFAIIVSDVEASSKWYRAVFGLEVQSRMQEEGSYDIVNLMAPGIAIELRPGYEAQVIN